MKPTAILFDLDGTVLDTYDVIAVSMRHASEAVLGKTLPDSVLLAQVGQPLVTQVEAFSDDPKVREDFLAFYRKENEAGLCDKSKPFVGMKDLIVSLKNSGYQVGVVTSKRHQLAEDSLRYYGIYKHLDCLIALEESVNHKPHPEPLIVATKTLGVMLESCVYVGDSPFDMQAAHAAGIRGIGVTWGKFFGREILEGESPLEIVDTPAELEEALACLG